MRQLYTSPEMEIIKFTLKDVILASIIEETIPETIGGGEPGGEIDIDGL